MERATGASETICGVTDDINMRRSLLDVFVTFDEIDGSCSKCVGQSPRDTDIAAQRTCDDFAIRDVEFETLDWSYLRKTRSCSDLQTRPAAQNVEGATSIRKQKRQCETGLVESCRPNRRRSISGEVDVGGYRSSMAEASPLIWSSTEVGVADERERRQWNHEQQQQQQQQQQHQCVRNSNVNSGMASVEKGHMLCTLGDSVV